MKKNTYYLGIDVGSVSTNLVVIDENDNVIEKLYLRTSGQPINALCSGMKTIVENLGKERYIKGVGTTESGRQLASVIVGADIVKNEITAHAVAALIAKEKMSKSSNQTNFYGFESAKSDYKAKSIECQGFPNKYKVI